MFTDTLQNLPRYRGLHPALDTAIDYLLTHDLAALPDGRTTVDGDKVFINVMQADLRPAAGATFEYHRRYADLQINITGAERWGWASEAQPVEKYDPDKDCGFAAGPEHSGGILGQGRFVYFAPDEYHKPSCQSQFCAQVRKAVVKILIK